MTAYKADVTLKARLVYLSIFDSVIILFLLQLSKLNRMYGPFKLDISGLFVMAEIK